MCAYWGGGVFRVRDGASDVCPASPPGYPDWRFPRDAGTETAWPPSPRMDMDGCLTPIASRKLISPPTRRRPGDYLFASFSACDVYDVITTAELTGETTKCKKNYHRSHTNQTLARVSGPAGPGIKVTWELAASFSGKVSGPPMLKAPGVRGCETRPLVYQTQLDAGCVMSSRFWPHPCGWTANVG